MLGALDPNDHTPVQTRMPTWVTHVHILSVDGGDPLYVRGYNLGKKVWLEPGIHKLQVECTTRYSWGTRMMFADVQIDIQPGYTYLLTTNPLRNESDVAKVEVIKEATK
ncbi:MAG: hypothetical protein H0X66_18300 [Verrucomicrobia bacterium]|nr:hypothetical protein [Verrucomicrobiota bacterium]